IFSKARMTGMQRSSASRAALYHAGISPPLIPAHSAPKTRVNALMLGIQGPQSVTLGPRFRGDERTHTTPAMRLARALVQAEHDRGQGVCPEARFSPRGACAMRLLRPDRRT